MGEVCIESGGFIIKILCKNQKVIENIKKDYNDFITQTTDIDFTVSLEVKNERLFQCTKDTISFDGGLTGQINLKDKCANVKVGTYNNYAFVWPLTTILIFLCNQNDGFLIHASGIVKNGKTLLFTGVSGAGKSTIASLSSDFTLLSDEYVIVRKQGNKYKAFGTCFGGDFYKTRDKLFKPTNYAADVDKLFFIHQSEDTRISEKKPANSLEKLITQDHFFQILNEINPTIKREFIKKHMDILTDFLEEIGCYDLYFTKSDKFLEKIENLD